MKVIFSCPFARQVRIFILCLIQFFFYAFGEVNSNKNSVSHIFELAAKQKSNLRLDYSRLKPDIPKLCFVIAVDIPKLCFVIAVDIPKLCFVIAKMKV